MANLYVDDLIKSGPDLFTNTYEVTFQGNAEFSKLLIRATRFPVPVKSRKTIDLSYHNTKTTISTPFFNYSRRVTFDMRVDANMQAYEFLDAWIASNQYDNPTLNAPVGTMVVKEITPEGDLIRTWEYYDCIFISMGENISFNYNTSGVVTVPVTFIYSTFRDAPSDKVKDIKTTTTATQAEDYQLKWEAYGDHMAKRDAAEVARREAEQQAYDDHWAAYGESLDKHSAASKERDAQAAAAEKAYWDAYDESLKKHSAASKERDYWNAYDQHLKNHSAAAKERDAMEQEIKAATEVANKARWWVNQEEF